MSRTSMRAGPWLALAGAGLLGGCASLQLAPPADPVAGLVPPVWQATLHVPDTPAAEAAADPWAAFGDPDLPALVAQALAQGTSVAAAQARLRQARATRDLGAAALQPSIGGNASARGSGTEGAGHGESWQAGLDASWELDLWGGGRAGLRAAEAQLAASALTLAQTRIVVAAEVAATLIDLRGAQARAAIAERNLTSQRQTLQIVQWRHEAGLVTALDVAQARTAVDQTRAQLPALNRSAQQALHALAVLTGQPPAALQATLGAPAPPVLQPLAANATALALPAEVLRQRPDVQAAERQLAAAAARVQQADAARLPSLSLGGSIGLSAPSLGALGPGAGVASLLASVKLPVLDFGRIQAQVQQQEAARDEAAVAYRASVLAALQDVEDSLVALAAADAQLQAQQAAAESAREAAALAGQRYRSGLVDFATVLQSERTLLATEEAAAATRAVLATAQVRLIKALGGGWSPGAPLNAAAMSDAARAVPPEPPRTR